MRCVVQCWYSCRAIFSSNISMVIPDVPCAPEVIQKYNKQPQFDWNHKGLSYCTCLLFLNITSIPNNQKPYDQEEYENWSINNQTHNPFFRHALPSSSSLSHSIRAGFLSCVYGISYLKCGKSEAIFLKKVTETLSYSDVHQEKCRKVSLRTCSSGKSSSGVGGLVALGIVITLARGRFP